MGIDPYQGRLVFRRFEQFIINRRIDPGFGPENLVSLAVIIIERDMARL